MNSFFGPRKNRWEKDEVTERTEDSFISNAKYAAPHHSIQHPQAPEYKRIMRASWIIKFEHDDHLRSMKEFVKEQKLEILMKANYTAAAKARLHGNWFEEEGCLAVAKYYENAWLHETQCNDEDRHERRKDFYDFIYGERDK